MTSPLVDRPVLTFDPGRCCCCPRTTGSTCWVWRICCRNTLWWRPTSPSRPTASATSTATPRSSPATPTVRCLFPPLLFLTAPLPHRSSSSPRLQTLRPTGHPGPRGAHGVLLPGAKPAGGGAARPPGGIPPPLEVLLGDGRGGPVTFDPSVGRTAVAVSMVTWRSGLQEGWIREKEQILSLEDHGKDLTGTVRLLSQHKAFEDEMSGRAAHLQQTIRQGQQLVDDNHFGAEKIKERIQDIQVGRHGIRASGGFYSERTSLTEHFLSL